MGGSHAPEIERKYELDAERSLPDLTTAPGVSEALGPQVMELDATYFDTEDLRLAAVGVTLRQRTGGHDAGWHAKFPVATDTREEVRRPAGTSQTEVPNDLCELVRSQTLGASLVPVARIRTTRSEWELRDASGEVVAHVADDQVQAQSLRPEQPARGWREVEVELANGADSSVLDQLAAVLGQTGARPARTSSKLARALGDRLPARQSTRTPAQPPTAADIAGEYLNTQVAAVRAYDAGVRLDLPDAVHQFRVACRRLRSGLRAFRPVLDRERVTWLRAELRWLGRMLSPARDNEVLDAYLRTTVRALPPENVLGPVPARLTAHFARANADARTTALNTLDSERYRALLVDLVQFVEAPPWKDKARRPAAKQLRRPVRRAWRRLSASVDTARATEPGQDRALALHQVRKDAKRTRYTAEALQPVFGVELDRWRRKVKRVQTALGEHQDAVVTRAALRDLGIRAYLNGENAFTYGLLHAGQDQRAQQAEQDFARRWHDLRVSARPGWLR
jgi:CHAD domain-containing protein